MANLCEYYPCHDIKNEIIFNCTYCYCPLYRIECKRYGGNPIILKDKEYIKDCSNCLLPHENKFKMLLNSLKENDII